MYKNDGPYDAYIDVSRVGELYQVSQTTPLTFGGGVTLTKIQEVFSSIGETNKDYWYASILAEHIGKIGSVPVRNVCSSVNCFTVVSLFSSTALLKFIRPEVLLET